MPNDKIGSAHVQVYPCAYRGQVEQSGVTYLWNPESRLPTEHNITEAVNNVSTVHNGSYVISKAATVSQSGTITGGPLVIVIHGYRFEIDDLTSIATAVLENGTSVWASIKLKDRNTPERTGTDYKATSLANYDGSTGALDAANLFKGLVFDNDDQSSTAGVYSLCILTRASATSTTPFTVPSSSLLRLDATNIANVSSGTATADNITEHFVTQQLEVSGDVNIGDELHVGGTLEATGATTLGNTLGVTGAATFGGSIILSNQYATIYPANASNSCSLGDVVAGKYFNTSYVTTTRTNTIKGIGNNSTTIGDSTNGVIIAGATTVSGATTFNNNITLSNNAGIAPSTNGQSWVGSSTKHLGHAYINNMYGKLHGTIALETGLASIDTSGYITGLDAGCWYNVVAGGLKQGTINLGSLCFQVYVAPTTANYTVYYSNVAILDQLYVRVKSEGTGSTKGKISFEVHNSGWTHLTQSDLSSANIYITKIGS